ncbi:MAG TPA: M48 family metallopeptidase [Nitrospiria bacterium]
MQTTWNASYFDGQTACAVAVVVTLTPHHILIQMPERTITWRYAEIRQTQGWYAGEAVRLEKGGDFPEGLVIEDPSFLSCVHRLAPEAARQFHNPASRSKRAAWIALAGVAAAGAGLGIYFLGIPAAADFTAERIPVSWEEKLGRTAEVSLMGPSKICEDPALAAVIERIVRRLDEAAPDHPYTFHVTIVQEPVMNAFAAPGGRIVVFTGLLKKTQTPEELAGVLAHEMQHVLRRHATKAIFRDISTAVLLAAVAGDAGSALSAALKSAQNLNRLSYSRANETEADALGMKLLLDSGVDPEGMIRFFQELQDQYGDAPQYFKYLSTHPAASDRIRRLKKMAAAVRITPTMLVSKQEWRAARRGCLPADK